MYAFSILRNLKVWEKFRRLNNELAIERNHEMERNNINNSIFSWNLVEL
jgi:hypothetical protein